ncbi:MAG: ABC transporter ATP-binding protein [Chloroflexi bacterium]|nr:ABC transporter ATP-binding protein [Chloroflexota bacterium]
MISSKPIRLVDYVLRYKWHYLAGLLSLLSASFVVMLPPVIIRQAIDAIAAGTTSEALLGFGATILGLALLESVVRYTARRLISGISRRIEYDLRTDLATHLMALDQNFYLKAQTGDLMARATNDLQRVRDLLGPSLQDLFRLPAMMAVGFVLMLSIDQVLAVLALAYYPVIAFFIIILRTRMESRFRAVQDQFGTLTIRVQENISGMRTIKAYVQEDAEIANFVAANQEMVRRAMSWARFSAGLIALTTVAGGASLSLVLWFGGHSVVEGRLSLGQFVQFIAYLAILANPVLSLGWTVSILQGGIAGWRRVKEILVQEPDIADPLVPVHLARIQGVVEFSNVTFGYDGHPVLRNINLKVPAGTAVAIVGETGAGKTTLMNLLVRLHDPWEGVISLDGVDIRSLPLEQLRAAVGVVPQESFLFSEPLSDNIAYASPNPDPVRLQAALATSQLVTDLPQFGDGLDTMVGERGVTLSGGQKQRAALARALLKEAPVLVLDDALSHVDTHTEEEILHRLIPLIHERTTFLIAHRTSTVIAADFIVALENGSIAEMGTHQELLDRHGVYARLYHRQTLAEQLESPDGIDAANGIRA